MPALSFIITSAFTTSLPFFSLQQLLLLAQARFFPSRPPSHRHSHGHATTAQGPQSRQPSRRKPVPPDGLPHDPAAAGAPAVSGKKKGFFRSLRKKAAASARSGKSATPPATSLLAVSTEAEGGTMVPVGDGGPSPLRLPWPVRATSLSLDSAVDPAPVALLRPLPRGAAAAAAASGALIDHGEVRRVGGYGYASLDGGPLGSLFGRRPPSASLSDGEEATQSQSHSQGQGQGQESGLRTSATSKAWRALFFHKGGKSASADSVLLGGGGGSNVGGVGLGLRSSLQSLEEAEAAVWPVPNPLPGFGAGAATQRGGHPGHPGHPGQRADSPTAALCYLEQQYFGDQEVHVV